MKTIVLKDLVNNTSSNSEGLVLYDYLQRAVIEKELLLLYVDNDLSLSSSFLNTSIGLFLDNYGIKTLKNTIKFKGSKNQYLRFIDYIQKYNSLYSL